MARRMPSPDLRPSWKDPNLPVIRDYRFSDGRRMWVVDPSYEQRYREYLMSSAATPSYRNDPTYEMRRKK